MGRFFLTVMAGAAELERNLIVERTKGAMAYKRSQGECIGEVPYGYQVDADGKTLVAEEGEQALIGAIREARERGLSQRAVVADLGRKGFTTRKGTAISLVLVQRIMQRENIA
jgi:DNA invertase Pin-like site-specific DNA recombinase